MLFEFMGSHPITIVFLIWFIGFILGYDFERFLNWLIPDKDDNTMNRYKISYTINGNDFNIRFVESEDIGSALRDFVSQFPEVTVTEMIQV